MRKNVFAISAVVAFGMLTAGMLVSHRADGPVVRADETKADDEKDREAIRQSSREFSEAFAKGDAKAVASHWTEHGEYQEEGRESLRGRAAIEAAFVEYF